VRAVLAVLKKKKSSPRWRGEDSKAGGRPSVLTDATRQELVKTMLEKRGSVPMSAAVCQKMVPALRKVSKDTVYRALKKAGFAHAPRRKKRSVPKEWREKRLEYCSWLLSRRKKCLERFVYTDGTSFFLARGQAEDSDKKRAGLGPKVWRMADGKDSLWDENVGPSSYAKSQGQPVKIWGFFAAGQLFYEVLPADGARSTNMTGDRYRDLVKKKFSEWREKSYPEPGPVYLVQDHERCLWQPASLQTLREAGLTIVSNYPKHSPDFNAIEGWWNMLRMRLGQTAPVALESRAAFVQRLRRSVKWLNDNRGDQALALATNQKKRAREVQQLEGAKCKY